MGTNINIASLDIDVEKLIKNTAKTAMAIKDLKEQQDVLDLSNKEALKQFVANAAALKNLETTYKNQQAALSAQIAEEEKLINIKKNVNQAVKQQNDSENAYVQNNKQLIELKKQLSISDDDYEKRLAKINAKIAENNTWLKENGSAHASLMVTMDDAKTKFAESFAEINVFNGGLTGLISRAQEAGGGISLLKGAFGGMAEGFKGMGKAFLSNPLGIFLAILGPVIQKLMSMPPITNAVEKAMAAIGPVLETVTKPLIFIVDIIGAVIDGFTNFVNSSTEAGRAAQELEKAQEALKKEQEALSAAMSVQEEKNEKAKQDAQALMEIANNQAKSEAERTKALEAAAAIERQNMAERKKLADNAYNAAVKEAALKRGLTAQEITDLKNGGAAYAEKMRAVKGFTQEEIEALTKAGITKLKLNNEEKQMLKGHGAARQKISTDAKAQRDAANAAEDRAEEARQQKRDKLRQDAITKQKLELELFIKNQGTKARTLKEELDIQEQVYKKRMAIINAEFAASDKSANAKLQKEIAIAEEQNKILQYRSAVAVENADKELQAYVAANQKNLEDSKALTAQSIAEEKTKLDGLLAEQNKYEKARLDNGLITQKAYDAAIAKLKADNNAAGKTLDEALVKQDKDKKAADLAAEYQKRREGAATDFEKQRIDEEERHTTRIADLKQQLADKKITQDQYNLLEIDENKKTAEEQKKINQAAFNNKLDLANQTFGSLQSILGKESAAGKAMAVAQATIDTYKSATAAYGAMSGIPVVGPALGAVAAAAAVAAGIQNVKKITATKPPKAEKGALFNIGGQRHSAGGTLFTGADGTQFEAEKGELIGVMNRNAARHFMAFNNAFPAGGGSAPNYFAGGGIVSREVAQQSLNVDELAAKIAQANAAIPAPVVAVQDIITQGNSYVRVRDGANF
ncbi:hypothetical protein [Flavobacterium psychrotrophum]|uniref:hypothetical protein n=1 Tax=Flavobacterium psychrotrophum TaxID=2294119 RepID=UPI000E30FFF3|nr:hypothetical protein [Flavobacterium psychrotrophum]